MRNLLEQTWILLAVACSLISCSRAPARVIGVVPKGTNHIFWQTVRAGAIKAANEFNYQVEWNAPALEIDASRQIQIVDAMVNRRLSAVVVAPIDRTALVAPLERAARAGVPVVVFDSDVATQRVTYVATNNHEAGRMAARRMGGILAGKGSVAIIGFMPGSASTMEREQGFQETLSAEFPGIKMVALQFGQADRARAMQVTENILAAHPDLSGLFADNESSSSGAVQALKSRANRKTKLVAFDASDQLIADLREGWIDSIVVQNPFRMGYESVRAACLKLAGQTPPAVIDSGARIVQASELAQPEVHALLFPDLKPYLQGTVSH